MSRRAKVLAWMFAIYIAAFLGLMWHFYDLRVAIGFLAIMAVHTGPSYIWAMSGRR